MKKVFWSTSFLWMPVGAFLVGYALGNRDLMVIGPVTGFLAGLLILAWETRFRP
jgi:hypothetical protein